MSFCGPCSIRAAADDQFDAADSQPISFLQAGTLHPLTIDERAVGAVEIVDLRVRSLPRSAGSAAATPARHRR